MKIALNEQAWAKVLEIGMAAMPWIDRQSNAVFAQMMEAIQCRCD